MSTKCPAYDLGRECCFRIEGRICTVLRDTDFHDYKCHFRKDVIDGLNMYDLEKRSEKRGEYEE